MNNKINIDDDINDDISQIFSYKKYKVENLEVPGQGHLVHQRIDLEPRPSVTVL